MAALDYLRQAGLVVELEGKRLRVTPASRITDEHRQYLNNHRVALLAELKSPTIRRSRQYRSRSRRNMSSALLPRPHLNGTSPETCTSAI